MSETYTVLFIGEAGISLGSIGTYGCCQRVGICGWHPCGVTVAAHFAAADQFANVSSELSLLMKQAVDLYADEDTRDEQFQMHIFGGPGSTGMVASIMSWIDDNGFVTVSDHNVNRFIDEMMIHADGTTSNFVDSTQIGLSPQYSQLDSAGAPTVDGTDSHSSQYSPLASAGAPTVDGADSHPMRLIMIPSRIELDQPSIQNLDPSPIVNFRNNQKRVKSILNTVNNNLSQSRNGLDYVQHLPLITQTIGRACRPQVRSMADVPSLYPRLITFEPGHINISHSLSDITQIMGRACRPNPRTMTDESSCYPRLITFEPGHISQRLVIAAIVRLATRKEWYRSTDDEDTPQKTEKSQLLLLTNG